MVQCPKCSAENKPETRFCSSCGQELSSVSQMPTMGSPEQELPPAPVQSPHAGNIVSSGSVPAGGLTPGTILADRYRIMELVGRGGMGDVWIAEQLKPVRRKVALKVIRSGMDSKQIIARFESEKQALAMMDHPAIAKIFDAGETELGQPYFVMEYVPGIPVTTHCDQNRLSLEERLELFMQTCEGVQHAHQKAIIHRDLKPSNILIAIQDGRAVPKIIDFGVAKATTQTLTEKTMYTELGMLIGTPEYMSPEQAEMSGQNIDTRTDIYSLGVILYELLTGILPFDPGELRRSGFDEIRRRIREVDPPKPSTRLSTIGEPSIALARKRSAELPVLVRQLKGDLDWITMKSMEKDRARRYASASEFAADIKKFQNQEPISARPPSVIYKLGKFTQRHRIGITIGVLLLGAMIAGISGTTVGMIRAKKAERLAQEEAARAQAINEFMQETLGSANPIEGQGREITLLEVLENSVDRIHESFTDQPDVEAQLKFNIGGTFLRLGYYEMAETLLKESLDLFQRHFGTEDSRTISPTNSLAMLKQELGDYEASETYYRQALELSTRVNGEEHQDTIFIMSNLALLLQAKEDLDAAEQLMRRILRIESRILGDQDFYVALDRNNLGNLLIRKEEYEESEILLKKACSILKGKPPWLAVCMGNQGQLLTATGDYQKAESILAEALSVGLEHLGEKNQDVAIIRYKYGNCLLKQRKLDNAEEQLEIALPILQQSLGLQNRLTQQVIGGLVELYALKGDREKESNIRALLQ